MQVTLQILTALIEKAPKDLALFAPTILKILEQILKSRDITMVESSLPTLESFCEHHDPTSLLADQAYCQQYISVVRQYATLASTRFSPGKVPPSKPVSLRWRNSGLEAIRSVACSEALSSLTGRQYDIVVPMILENLWTDNEDFLETLLQRAVTEEKTESGVNLKRRTSVATVGTADTGSHAEPNPIALAGSAGDVDKLAEEDIGVLAMQCLKQIFVVPNRSQIHAATAALLKFTEERVSQQEDVVRTSPATGKDGGWAIKMFGLVSRWAPVQDRYTILITAIDAMAQTALADEKLQQHIVLAAMVGSLLRSDQNLIGLSVMDVLIQLMAQIRRLVQMPGDPAGARNDRPGFGQPDIHTQSAMDLAEKSDFAGKQRRELLERLQSCIGDLATHVYYSDQISDMISTILLKLKPGRSNSASASSPQGEKAEGASPTHGGADDHHPESLFSLSVAKTAALQAIKSILLVANPRSKMSGNIGLARNRVPVQVWEGTQWLLRDPDGIVRKAYADALATWLDRETTRADLRARDDTKASTKLRDLPPGTSMARRAVSSASHRADKAAKVPRSHFLAMIHVACYDSALQYVDYDADMVLLHVLLAKLVYQLGINAVRYGLPMIFRLQEDIQDAETPMQKVRIGSLVHGYLWVISDKFDLESSLVGPAIHNEIIRRRSKHFWVEGVHIPPPMLELIGIPGHGRPGPRLVTDEVESEALLPFDDRLSLVDCICTAYQERPQSAPTSPAASPAGRNFTHPIFSSTLSTIPAIDTDQEVPLHFREEMLVEWSQEAVLATVQAESKSASLSGSRAGTTGTNRRSLAAANHHNANNRLTVHEGQAVTSSPAGSHTKLRPATAPGLAVAGAGLALQTANLRKSSVRSTLSPAAGSASASSRGHNITSVQQLKLVLSGDLAAVPAGGRSLMFGEPDDDNDDDVMDGSSESMVSYDMAPSEQSSTSPKPAVVEDTAMATTPKASAFSGNTINDQASSSTVRPSSRERKQVTGSPGAGGPLSSHPTTPTAPTMTPARDTGGDAGVNGAAALPHLARPNGHDGATEETGDEVPPVPPLPQGLERRAGPVAAAQGTQRPTTARHSVRSARAASMHSLAGRRRDRAFSSSWASVRSYRTYGGGTGGREKGAAAGEGAGVEELAALLKGIDAHAGERSLGTVTRPPY